MRKLALSSVAVASLVAVSAQAEPLVLTGDQMDKVTAAGFGFADFDAFLSAFKDIETDIDFDKDAFVDVDVNISGYLADAEAFANCNGTGCTAETFTGADSDPFGVRNSGFPSATAASNSVAASSF